VTTARGPKNRDAQLYGWLALAFLALYLLTASGRIDSGDGQAMYQVIDSAMNGRGFTISAASTEQDFLGPRGERIPYQSISGSSYGAFGVDGRYYAKSGPGQSVAAIPFYLLGKLAHVIWPAWSERCWTEVAVTFLNAVVTALMVVLVAMMARLFFGQSTALALAVVFGFATPAWPYSKSFFNEPLLGALMLLGGYAAMRARRESQIRWYAVSGAALGAAVFTKPTAALVGAVLAVYLFVTSRPTRYQWAAWLGMFAVPMLVLACYNWLRFGNPFVIGYGETAQWNTPPWLGAYGLLFSSGKGLVWFAPVVVIGVGALPAFIHRAKAEGWLVISVAGVFITAHTFYSHWHGGGCWGPRLIVPVVAWLIVPLGEIFERRSRPTWQELGLAVVIAASVIVQVLGISVNYARHLQTVYQTSNSTEDYFNRVQFSWADSPIAGQVGEWRTVSSVLRHPEGRVQLHALVADALATPPRDDPFYDARAEALGLLGFNTPDYWFVYGWLLGIPIWVMVAMATALVIMMIVSWRSLRALLLSA
jgi:hypothetical protein